MIRLTAFVAALGVLTAGLTAHLFIRPARQNPASDTFLMAVKAWPICSWMGTAAEGAAWPPLDPEFAGGKRALAAGDWSGAIKAFSSAALRDTRNADIQNYLGYAHGRLRQLDLAFLHYRQALSLNPRHRGARGHLGEAYLLVGDLTSAQAQLEALERICLIPCEEHGDLERAITIYRTHVGNESAERGFIARN